MWKTWLIRTHAELALHALRQVGIDFDSQCIHTPQDFIAQLDWPPDVILADYALPQFDALRALRLLQERRSDVPFIVITGSLKQGATDYLLNAEARQLLKTGQSRVRAMALVHQKLYQAPDLARIGFTQYLRELATQLFQSFGVDGDRISLRVTGTDVYLGIDTAIPCALIVNELMCNSLRHAFPNARQGEIVVDFQTNNGAFTLTVSDNGIGFPATIPFPNPASLGWQIIKDLSEQLDGRLSIRNGSGTTFQFVFNELTYRERGYA